MAQAFKCDRCEKLFEGIEENAQVIQITDKLYHIQFEIFEIKEGAWKGEVYEIGEDEWPGEYCLTCRELFTEQFIEIIERS